MESKNLHLIKYCIYAQIKSTLLHYIHLTDLVFPKKKIEQVIVSSFLYCHLLTPRRTQDVDHMDMNMYSLLSTSIIFALGN